MKALNLIFLCNLVAVVTFAQQKKLLPVIDMHLHAIPVDDQGPPPLKIGAPFANFSAFDPQGNYGETFIGALKSGAWNQHTIASPITNAELQTQVLNILKKRNIYAVCSGDLKIVRRWKSASPKRIINAVYWDFAQSKKAGLTVDSLTKLFKSGEFKVFGEIALQYEGISIADSTVDAYLQMAEQLDIPVGVHVGTGPPGVVYLGATKMRARLSSPLILEEVLVKHPKLRLYAMHAGWPMIDDMIAMLYAYPQLHVDIGVIDYILPKKEFYQYLQRLVDAGFGKRIMFGSDQMVWPQAIEVAINNIENAPFLSASQKRDILFNNAARFMRLSDQQIKEL